MIMTLQTARSTARQISPPPSVIGRALPARRINGICIPSSRALTVRRIIRRVQRTANWPLVTARALLLQDWEIRLAAVTILTRRMVLFRAAGPSAWSRAWRRTGNSYTRTAYMCPICLTKETRQAKLLIQISSFGLSVRATRIFCLLWKKREQRVWL